MKWSVYHAVILMAALLTLPIFGQDSESEEALLKEVAAFSKPVPTTSFSSVESKPLGINDLYALEFARSQIKLETERLDKLISNTEVVGKLIASLVVAFAAFFTFFGYRSIKELKNELNASAESIVDKALREKAKSSEDFSKLASELEQAVARWEKIKRSLDDLEKFETLSSSEFGDAKGAYQMAKEISENPNVTPEERRAALGYLLKIIELGKEGRVDPDLLFNASAVASQMGFDHEALKLASLCAYWDPKPTHILRKSRLEDSFGMRYQFKGNELIHSDQSPASVRKEAWRVAKETVLSGPVSNCELIYSEFSNIAIQNGEWGYIDEAIEVLEQLTSEENTPSYAFVALSKLYAFRSNSSWKEDFLRSSEQAIKTLSTESPMNTWYHVTIRELLSMAKRTGTEEEIQTMMGRYIQQMVGVAMDGSGI